jgi:hypothetical protein
MNIKNRLKKVENQIIGNDSDFCVCERETKTIILIPTADGKGKTIDGGNGEPYTETELPESCDNCGKPFSEPLRITFTINPKVELTGEA